MSRVITSTLVARKFVIVAREDGESLDPLQLQKLAFFAHGWAFPILKKSLIYDRIEAWPYGPVFPELYIILRKYERKNVVNVPMSNRELVANEENEVILDKREENLICRVYNTYGRYSGSDLIELTHNNGGPWDNTAEGDIIDDFLIREYFEKKDKIRKQQSRNT